MNQSFVCTVPVMKECDRPVRTLTLKRSSRNTWSGCSSRPYVILAGKIVDSERHEGGIRIVKIDVDQARTADVIADCALICIQHHRILAFLGNGFLAHPGSYFRVTCNLGGLFEGNGEPVVLRPPDRIDYSIIRLDDGGFHP